MLSIKEFMEKESLWYSAGEEIKEGEQYPLVRLVTQPEAATISGWYSWFEENDQNAFDKINREDHQLSCWEANKKFFGHPYHCSCVSQK